VQCATASQAVAALTRGPRARADIVSGKEVAALAYHREIVRDCSWHPTQPMLATVSWDGSIVMWAPPRDDEKGRKADMPEPGWDELEDHF
jgi:WD repeat-containing protein 23